MKLINKEDFLNWAKKKNIQIYAESNVYSLSLTNDKSLRKSWAIPDSASGGSNPHFFSKFLENVDDWGECYVFKADGKWEPFGSSGDVWANLIHKIGVPEDFEGAIGYNKSELVDLLSLLYVQTSFAWCGADEFFIVFDHGQQIIFVDEDHNLHIEFNDKGRLDKFISDLNRIG